MGACSIHVTEKGPTMKEAFKTAIEEANEEYGHQQGYSGAINCCSLLGDKTSLYNQLGEEEFEEWAYDNTDKREVIGYKIEEGKYGFIGWAPE